MKKCKNDFSRQEVFDFVTHYYSGHPYDSLKSLAEFYGISMYMAKQLIYRSIGECIVDDDVVEWLYQKACSSAFVHSYKDKIYKAPLTTHTKYESLKQQRQAYLFPDDICIDIAVMYAFSPLSKEPFCKENYMTKALFDRILKHVIIHNLISDDFVDDLQEKALQTAIFQPKVYNLFTTLWELRIQNRIKDS